jgi:alkaline phosphatase D
MLERFAHWRSLLKITRRNALRGAGALGVSTAIGCGEPSAGGFDAGPTGHDAGYTGPVDGGPRTRDGGPAPTGPFLHGVASGDPLADAVILWTRVTLEGVASAMVEWEMSTDPTFAAIAASGTATTDASRDWTVKVDATGLDAASTYYYRFTLMGTSDVSPIGRTRTAPSRSDDVARLRFAVCSCSSYSNGYFHGYKNIAARADLDAVIHLGDYIYEHGTDSYGRIREYDPPHEIETLADYRRRYAYYREDPDLREAHRQHPFIVVWDDHESANNSWRDGAQNHTEGEEGTWVERRAAAQQAFSEWIPIRGTDPSRIWRTLPYGALADLTMLDTRLEGRTEQGEGAEETRRLLSEAQEAFLLEALTTSTARWKLIGQQVVFSPVPPVLNPDAWDGYAVQRARVLDTIASGGAGGSAIEDVVVLTGDIHMSFAVEVVADGAAVPLPPPLAIEFVAPGITSPALGPGPITDSIAERIRDELPYVKHYDLISRGYIVLDLTETHAQADFVATDAVEMPYDDGESDVASWRAASGSSRLEATTTLAPPGSPPALAP